MNKSKINLLVAILAILIINGCADVSTKKPSKDPIKIGIDIFPGWDHLFIAQKKEREWKFSKLKNKFFQNARSQK